jgi:DNA-binding MarR family transcriptional regulator
VVTCRRDPDNRRAQVIELTSSGHEAFHRLRTAAVRHDRRLHAVFDGEEVEQLRSLLARLGTAVDSNTQTGGAADPVTT